ncbi:MAG TPA: hypothetical protein PKA94_09545, partial [Ferruginibacter sp.]|nr:hypothetical protein [Ferruginibacter sp.]
MQAKSIKGKSPDEIKTALDQSMADGFNPTLAICFISKSLNRVAITGMLDAAGITVFGCTTNGEFIDEQTDKNSAAILLMDMNKEYFELYFEEYPGKNYREVAKKIAGKA